MEVGKPAPFSGILLTPAALAKVITELERKTVTCQTERDAERAEAEAKRNAAEQVCTARVDAERAKTAAVAGERDAQRVIYEKALSKCSASPPWYKSRYLAFIAGAAVAGGVCAAR